MERCAGTAAGNGMATLGTWAKGRGLETLGAANNRAGRPFWSKARRSSQCTVAQNDARARRG